MPRYYCTCKKDKRTPHDYQHTQYHETEVNKDEICIWCGFYAFTRASIAHELFPRHGRKVTAMEVYKNISAWSDNNLYNQYFHGHDKYVQGLSRRTLDKDKERIKNEREQKLGRVNGNRG